MVSWVATVIRRVQDGEPILTVEELCQEDRDEADMAHWMEDEEEEDVDVGNIPKKRSRADRVSGGEDEAASETSSKRTRL
jgi:hypothetical protein